MAKRLNVGSAILFIVIPLLPIFIFYFMPMIVTFFTSFSDWNYVSEPHLIWMENYSNLFQSPDFYQSLLNTVYFGLGTLVPSVIIGFLLGYLISNQTWGKNFFRASIFAPYITPTVAMSIVWSSMYAPEGLINRLLSFVGISGPSWLTDSNWALTAVVIMTVWKNAGYAMLFYASDFSTISKSYFEVSDLEGANFWDRLRYIYIPMSTGTTFFLTIILLINSIQAYDQISVLTQGGPSGSTRTLLYYYYQLAFEQFDMGQATALAIVIVALTGILAFGLQKLRHRYDWSVQS